MNNKSGKIERAFERALLASRFAVILAVITSLLGAFLLFAMATVDVTSLTIKAVALVADPVADWSAFHAKAIERIIAAVDDYLLATVLLLFALGLYELFISKIDAAEDETHSNILIIKSLDDLKDRLGKVILMILIVTFFKSANKIVFGDPVKLLFLGAGILCVALALYFTHGGGKGKTGGH